MSIANAAHCSMMGGIKFPLPPYRYMKIIIPRVAAPEANNQNEYNVQVSKLDIIDLQGQYFNYPAATSYTISHVFNENSGEGPLQLLRHSTSYKMCICISKNVYPPQNFPVEIVYDFKSPVLDTNVYSRWQIYTSNDTYNGGGAKRNPSMQLLFGIDGSTWRLADEVSYTDFPNANKRLAFTRTLFANV